MHKNSSLLRRGFLFFLHRLSRVFYRRVSPLLSIHLEAGILGKFFGPLIAPREAVYTCDYGIRLKLSRADALALGIAYMGMASPLETALLFRYLRPNDTFIEIGTYKDGWLGLVASGIVGPGGRVICFEPVPEYCAAFAENLRLSNRHNITLEQLAVSREAGEALLSIGGMSSAFSREKGEGDILVKTVTLDGYLTASGAQKADFLVIDAEGAEPLILSGAQKTLGTVSYLLLEVINEFLLRHGTTAHQLIESLQSQGFYPYILTKKGLRPWQAGLRSHTRNMFFSRKKLSAPV